jgi:hypothetical protein
LQWNFYLRFDVIHVNNLFTAWAFSILSHILTISFHPDVEFFQRVIDDIVPERALSVGLRSLAKLYRESAHKTVRMKGKQEL